MPTPPKTTLGLWSGRSTFFWAAAAATIGLGNLWHFPWLASQFGGGYFVLLYLFFLLVITLPLLMAEAALGRRHRHNLVLAMRSETRDRYQSPRWRWLGRVSVLSGFLVLSITLVIGSICLAYVFYGAFGRFGDATPLSMTGMLAELVESPYDYREFMAWHAFFILLVGAVAFRQELVERAFRLVMPVFLALLLGLVWWSWEQGVGPGALESVAGLRWQDVNGGTVWFALSHAFYTLGIGLGIWAVLGALMAPGSPFKRAVFGVALLDTLVGVLAGVVIYGIAESFDGYGDVRGFGLVFVALPVGLGGLEYHQLLATAVFTLIVLVAWSSALVLTESVVSWLREWVIAPRPVSVLLVLVCAWLMGLVTLYSFNIWADVQVAGLTPFRWIELLTSGLLIPAVAAALAVFLGWLAPVGYLNTLLGNTQEWLVRVWRFALRYLLPVTVIVVGAGYSMMSLKLLCDNGELIWCTPSAHELSGEPPAGDGERRRGPGKAAEF
ncbi:neurotransmitter:Na+ symporter, NSS family [Marinobacter segnicrescens]|uniref:Neurotransmitter:Na+ symporter, NSS family n=1 Tax=Marinobacter segnicrescens TaxID=430453 RepID=A0A1I0H0V7_9GAMM|nr:sodium-dependent transporter [Marinobacter segnicrescens]SET76311.1 neurotransmitter:Na+ symporter, NSS family [Marinobacter segnicrescens]